MNRSIVLLVGILLMTTYACADEIHLKNGDRISGSIVSETSQEITIDTQAMGQITVSKNFIRKSQSDEEVAAQAKKEEKDKRWERKLSFGYSQAEGNTEDSEGTLKLKVNYRTDHDEWTFLSKGYYSSSNGKMDGRKYYGQTRYAYSFGDSKKWYNFYKFEGNQDRFANVDYRLTPSVGVGYWFSDDMPFKALVELAAGYEHTNFRGSTKSTNEAILVPRGLMEVKLLENLTLKQDVTLYPSLSETGEYRLHSETDLIHPMNEKVNLKLSLIDDFDSKPSGTAKKNDLRLISSLEYVF